MIVAIRHAWYERGAGCQGAGSLRVRRAECTGAAISSRGADAACLAAAVTPHQGAPYRAAVFTPHQGAPYRAAVFTRARGVRPARTLPESLLDQPVRPLRAHAALSPRRSSRIIAHPAGVAQLVEQRIRNAWVGGSIPFSGTNDCSAFGCDFDDRAGVSRQERLRTGQAFEQNPCLTDTSKTRFGRLAQR